MTPARIHVRFRIAGNHHWKDAPKHRKYLGLDHRHLFHVEVSTEVTHDDREIEFHDLRDQASACFEEQYVGIISSRDLGEASCEAIARAMGEMLAQMHKRPFSVTVWEDGECGATVNTLTEPDVVI